MRRSLLAIVLALVVLAGGCSTIDRALSVGGGIVHAVADSWDVLHGPVSDVADVWAEFGDLFGADAPEAPADAGDTKSAPEPEPAVEPVGDAPIAPVARASALRDPRGLSVAGATTNAMIACGDVAR